MGNKINRVVVALLIGFTFPIFAGNQVVSAAPAVSGVLGDSCMMFFQSRVIAADSTLTTEIAGVCFPSLNNPDIFIWSKDNNQIPAYTLVVDGDNKIGFGRNCVIKDPNDCSIPDPKPSGYLEAEPFVRAYPDTRYYPDNNNLSRTAETFGGLWFSETYISNIVRANYVAPEAVVDEEDTAQVNEPISSQAVSGTLLIGLAAAVSLTSAAGSSSNQPSQNRPGSPESPEPPDLLRARKERRFTITNQFSRFSQGSVISMDRWAFFTAKMPALIRWFGKRSAVIATSIGDADYLRAVLGIFSLLIYPVAIIIGAMESISRAEKTSPIPGITWLVLAIVIGCFDSLAGAISAITFASIAVLPKLRDAGIDWPTFIGGIIIVYILSTGPALFAGALRRFDGVHTSRKGKWERFVDYALSPIVTAWVVWKGLELLPKISELKVLNWADDIQKIAVIVFISIFLRYFLEGFVAKNFSERINEIVTESIPMQKWPHIAAHIRKGILVSFIASLLLVPETVSIEIMWLLFFILLLPAATHALGFSSVDRIAKFNVIGTPRLVFLLCVGSALNSIFDTNSVNTNLGLYIFLAFAPILYFNLMEALTESHLKSPAYFYQTKNGKLLYRAGSVLIYLFILWQIYTQVGWEPFLK
jgi:hypothetical protein